MWKPDVWIKEAQKIELYQEMYAESQAMYVSSGGHTVSRTTVWKTVLNCEMDFRYLKILRFLMFPNNF